MNDVAKQRIVDKLFESIKSEGLTQTEVAKIFKIDNSYLSSIKRQDQWKFCSVEAWEKLLVWVNSGQTLREYSEKHGKVLSENHELRPGTVFSRIIETRPKEEPIIKVKPDALTKRLEELELSKSMMGSKPECQKIIIDIEINLIINGKKIEIR